MTSTARIVHGSGAAMNMVGAGEADLVLTSPPYFPEETLPVLAVPGRNQAELGRVEREVAAYALGLRPVFDEIARVLRPGGALVLQTKDIRYAGFLCPLVDLHTSLALGAGLRLVTRVLFLPSVCALRRQPAFVRKPRRGTFRALDPEHFLVFSHGCGIAAGEPIELAGDRARRIVEPLWRLPHRRRPDDHPYGSPRAAIRRFIELFSAPGDLVVDPFAGHGTTLVEAHALGRSAIGWEIDARRFAVAFGRLS